MLELTRFETRRHVKQALWVSAGLFGLVVLVVLIFPSFQEAGADFQEIVESMPDAMRAAFGGNVPFTTIEGFLVWEVYQLVWTMLVGSYVAYAAASLIAGDRERGNVDVLLMAPVSRRRIVAEKFLSMVPDVVVISLCTFLGVLVGTAIIDEAIDVYWLAVLHVLSVPYLLSCAAFGLLLSVAVDSERRAQILAFAGVSVSYVLEALTRDTDYEWIGAVTFQKYFSPGEILVENEVNLAGAAVLIAVAIALVIVAGALFRRADVTT